MVGSQRNQLNEHPQIIFKGIPYQIPSESQSAPVLHRNVKEHYYPEQSRTHKQQDYREYGNKRRGPQRNYETFSAGSSEDSANMKTVYNDSYNRNDYKKKIYDATSELAESRSKLAVEKDIFDPDENYEHMVIVGTKREQRDGILDESQSEINGFKSKAGTEYGVNSRNIKDIRASVDEGADIRRSIQDTHDVQNRFNDNMIQEGQQQRRGIKSKASADSEYYSRNIRASVDDEQATNVNNIKDTISLKKTLNDNDNVIQRGQRQHREIRGMNDPKSLSERQAQRSNLIPSSDKTSNGLVKKKMKSYSAPDEDDEVRKDPSSMDTEYDRRYSHNVEEIAELSDKSHSQRPENKTPLNDDAEERNNIPNAAERPPEKKEPKKKKFVDSKTSDKSESSMKSFNPTEEGDEMRKDPSSMDTEYDKRYSHSVEEIAELIDESRSQRPENKTPHNDDAEELHKKIKRNNIPNAAEQPPEGKGPEKKKFVDSKTSDKSESSMKSYNEYDEQESKGTNFKNRSSKQHDAPIKSTGATFNEHDSLRPGDMDSYENDNEFQNKYQGEEDDMENQFEENGSNAVQQHIEKKVYEHEMTPLGNITSDRQEKQVIPRKVFEKQGSEEEIISLSTEYDDAYNQGDVTGRLERKYSLKSEEKALNDLQWNDPDDEKLLSEKTSDRLNIKSTNKRSSIDETDEEEESRSNSPMTTEYGDAYGSENEDEYSVGDSNTYTNKSQTIGHNKIHIINSNKESENFVLGNEHNHSPLTSEYRDAFGAKIKYVIHQCSANLHREEMHGNRYRNIESNTPRLFSKVKVYEPKIIPLNNKTSEGQIELNMKSYNGNEIYSAFLYPDDPISKIWPLTELNYEEFMVTVDDEVLHINVPLKNYNINGDVTLNISKRKPSSFIKEVGAYKSKSYSDEGVDHFSDGGHFSDKVDYEEGYSS